MLDGFELPAGAWERASCRRAWTATTRRCSTCCVSPARSAGRGCRRRACCKTASVRHADRAVPARARRRVAGSGRTTRDPRLTPGSPTTPAVVLRRAARARRVVLQRSGGRVCRSTPTGCARRSACWSQPALSPPTDSRACACWWPRRRAARCPHDRRASLAGRWTRCRTAQDRAVTSRDAAVEQPGMDAAAALRRRVPAAADARDQRGAVARAGARLPPPRSARRNPRRPVRVRHGGRAVRAAGRSAGAARGAPHAGQRHASDRSATADPLNLAGIVTAGDARPRGQPQPAWPIATACRSRCSRTRRSVRWCRSRRRTPPPRPARWPAGPRCGCIVLRLRSTDDTANCSRADVSLHEGQRARAGGWRHYYNRCNIMDRDRPGTPRRQKSARLDPS